jgi:hypothetical protein
MTEYIERHPELAERIRTLFPALLAMEELGSAGGKSTGPYNDDDRPAVVTACQDHEVLAEEARTMRSG